MKLRQVACCAGLSLGLVLTAAPAVACDGADCAAAKTKTAKPLQLGKFMRPAAAKPVKSAAKATADVHRQAQVSRRPKIAPLPVAAAPEPLLAEAAAAFASQPAPDVRVVASDELNEIDLAAAPASPETNGMGRAAEETVRIAETTEHNDVDRIIATTASLTGSSGPIEASPVDRASLTWIERFWGGLQHTFAALAAGWRYLFG